MPRPSVLTMTFRLAPAFALAGLLVGCGSEATAPIPERATPSLIAVTAPRAAPPGALVFVLVHWLDRSCSGAQLRGFRTWHTTDGVQVLESRWEWGGPGVCLAVVNSLCRQQFEMFVMPPSGPLRFAVRMGDRRIDRTVESGSPVDASTWTIEALENGTRMPAVGAPLEFLRLDADASESSWTVIDTLLADTTGATGLHAVDIGNPADGPLNFAIVASYRESWNRFFVPILRSTSPPPRGEHTTLLVDWRYGSPRLEW